MKRQVVLFAIECFMGASTTIMVHWLESRSVKAVLSSNTPPPWDINHGPAIVAGVTGILFSMLIGIYYARQNGIRGVIISFLAFLIGALIAAVFTPARG